MDNNLIIDVGMHLGQDTEYYLRKGYRVVAIDADINLINLAKNRLEWYLKNDFFIALNYAISDKDNEQLFFNISEVSIWSSLNLAISSRENKFKEQNLVQSRTLSSVFLEYGVPYYCKIDIEGYDNICLKTLSPLHELPKFISVESECIGEKEILSDEEALQTLYTLYDLGYRNFKLVDQSTLGVLNYNRKFYFDDTKFIGKLISSREKVRIRNRFAEKLGFTFSHGSSGPFGEELAGKWEDFDMAIKTLIKHRTDYFKLPRVRNYGFWCDWHATSLLK